MQHGRRRMRRWNERRSEMEKERKKVVNTKYRWIDRRREEGERERKKEKERERER